jgi:hypothetical protein
LKIDDQSSKLIGVQSVTSMADEGQQIADSGGNKESFKPDVLGKGPGAKAVGTSTTSDASSVKPGTGPGGNNVGTIGIVCITLYLIGAILLCFYGLIAIWPGPSPSGQMPSGKAAVNTPANANPSAALPSQSTTENSVAKSGAIETPTPNGSAAAPFGNAIEDSSAASPPLGTQSSPAKMPRSPITIFGQHFEIWDEIRLLLIVILAGALGSLVHTVRSVYWYIGNRSLKWSWVAKYVLQPFAGCALAVIFYVVVRGGFFSPQTTFENTSPFGFAALAALVGLFSEQAVLKLKTVAETVLERPAPGANAIPQDDDSEGPPDDTTQPETANNPPSSK